MGQVIVGNSQVDYKSNCGNMTAAVGPFAVEEGLVEVTEPITTVHVKGVAVQRTARRIMEGTLFIRK